VSELFPEKYDTPPILRHRHGAHAIEFLVTDIFNRKHGAGMQRTNPGFSLSNSFFGKMFSGLALLQALTFAFPAYGEELQAASTATPPAVALQPDRITGEYITGYFSDTGKILASPVHLDRCDWLTAGLVIGATSGLYIADTNIRNFAQHNQNSTGKSIASVGDAVGNPLYTLPPLGLFYLYGHLNDDSKARHTSLLAFESFAISGAFTWAIKMTTGRPRPFTGESSTTWNGPNLKNSDASFSSGHTQSAFSIATVIAEEYGNIPLVPPFVYGLASLTGLSRVYNNKHWASDVFFGAAIGYFVGKTVVRYHSQQGTSPLTITPTANVQGFGLTAEYRF
jgi:membrane-associated phospholipid phosphatase